MLKGPPHAQLAKGDHFIHKQGRGLEEVDRPVSLLGILWRVDRQPLVGEEADFITGVVDSL